MSAYAQMHTLTLRREYMKKSETTGKSYPVCYESFPFRGSIQQVSQTDVNSNDKQYNKAGYVLTTYFLGLAKGDKVVEDDTQYIVTFVDRKKMRGPHLVQLEKVIADG